MSEYTAHKIGEIACDDTGMDGVYQARKNVGIPRNQLARKGRARPSHDCLRMFSTT